LKVARRLLLPAVVAAPLWPIAVGAILQGEDALTHADLEPSSLVFYLIVALGGLLAVGLPSAKLVRRWRLPPLAQAAFLLVAGAIGGAALTIIIMTGTGFSNGGSVETMLGYLALIAVMGGELGAAAGLTVALVWILFNLDALRLPPGRRIFE